MFDKYLTTASFEATALPDVLSFHEMVKVKELSSIGTYLQSSSYLFSERGVEEASRNRKVYLKGEVEALPDPGPALEAMRAAMTRRVSCRDFDADGPACAAQVRAALRLCCENRTGVASINMTTRMGLRPYPSAGGLYSVEMYLLERDAHGWSLHHVDAIDGTLRRIERFEAAAPLATAMCETHRDIVTTAHGAIILSNVWERAIVKYGHQGYKFSLMELGIVGHHAGLCLSAQGVDTLHWAGQMDDVLGAMMGLDGRSEGVGHVLWYGRARAAG